MKLGATNQHITISRNGAILVNFNGTIMTVTDEKSKTLCRRIYRIYRRNCSEQTKTYYSTPLFDELRESSPNLFSNETIVVDELDLSKNNAQEESQSVLAQAAIGKLINFFTEFDFEPNFRFINTFTRTKNKKEYVRNYFNLIDNPAKDAITDKMKSLEFVDILSNFGRLVPTKQINNRLKLYYGSQGTGKTTQAIKESSGVMVCHSAMLPNDLMEDFKFIDGKAHFIPSALQKAMTSGNVITLDEINLLPFESLRFLQSILDGKLEFEYKDTTIKIADGFKVIGTMNLKVNGMVYGLPEPLIDRCEVIKEFKLSAASLVGAI